MIRRIQLFALLSPVLLWGCPSSGPPVGLNTDGYVPDALIVDVPGQTDVSGPEGCALDADCPGGVCNLFTHTCVECIDDADCGDKAYCSKWQCVPMVDCEEDSDCPEGSVCDPESAVCVECVDDDDCPGGQCEENHCSLPCDNGCPGGMVCDELTNLCVECLGDENCPEVEWCYLADNECFDDQCEPWALGCVGNSTAVCAANGSGWTDLVPCNNGLVCFNGECVDKEICEPGVVSCLDEFTVLVCNDDGTELWKKPCPEGTFCADGNCIEDCVPDCADKECGPSNCPGFSCGECPEEWHCGDDFICQPGICSPGQTACIDGGVAKCMGPEEGWSESMPCPPGSFCVNGECQEQPWECVPGDKICKGNTPLFCLEDGSGWEAGKECPPDAPCVNGKCQDEPWWCEPGEMACEGNTVIMCGDDGQEWYVMWDCPPGTQCQWGGECVPGGTSDCEDVLNCMMDFESFEPDPWVAEKCFDDMGPSEIAIEIYFCVFDFCGMWQPENDCFEFALYEGCGWLYQECTQGCTPNCWNKECGGDGCGGSCGWCPQGLQCQGGQCIPTGQSQCKDVIECAMEMPCPPDIDPYMCLMGCSENGEVPDMAVELYFCVVEMCNEWNPWNECFEWALKEECGWAWEECMEECQPNCWNKECGGDGCGGSCGWCPPGLECNQGLCMPWQEQECAEVIDCMMGMPCEGPEPWWCLEECSQGQEIPGLAVELVMCVSQMCDGWMPWDECFQWALEMECGWLYQECMGGCQPDCAGKQCGPDGCGGQCGVCPPGLMCTAAAKCEKPCEPQCWSADGTFKECGGDGCGGSCGVCPAGTSCISSICVQICEPDCFGKQCGSDGCGGSCGLCDAEEACKLGACVVSLSCEELADCVFSCPPNSEDCGTQCWLDSSAAAKQQWVELMACVEEQCGPNSPPGCPQQAIFGACGDYWNECQNCTPDCVGKMCGADGCGGDCGDCPGGYVCDNFGTCLCQPQCEGKECGNDGCGGQCGECTAAEVCNFLGFCVCNPQCDNKQCGPDGCGGSCGFCDAGLSCNPNGKCTPGGPQNCGNGFCQPNQGESCANCPQDCPCGGACCEPKNEPGCDDPDIMWCVCEMDPFCCEMSWDSLCVDEAQDMCGLDCGGGCEPNCFNKECGADGCDGSCGNCPAGSSCNSGGICVQTCKPDCSGKECGSDGCGGSCGLCPDSMACDNDECITSLTCADVVECLWQCPPDDEDCGAGCWQDASPDTKQQWWQLQGCILGFCGEEPNDGCWSEATQGPCQEEWYGCLDCTPECVGSQCGPDGCGGSCGDCPGGYVCDNFGTCLCQPQCQGKVCGNDGCGGSCGTCPAGDVCNYLGQCVCMPKCQNKECGNDGCGGSCGQCPAGEVCQQGVCQVPPHCGNDFCQPNLGEDCQTCPEDCQCYSGDCCQSNPTPGCDDPDITACVCEMDSFCCNNQWDGLCVSEAQEQCGADCPCYPNCQGKQCGNDGCGGSCGQCPPGSQCNWNGQCTGSNSCGNGYCQMWQGENCETCPEDCGPCGCGDGACDMAAENCETCPEDCGPCPCEPQCWSADGEKLECGPDGCGGVCGYCPDNAKCVSGHCITACQPNCTIFGFPKQCGSDGCGGSCGTCPVGTQCDALTYQCVDPCQPQCEGKECGGDGCGGTCGQCPEGMECNGGTCGANYNCVDMIECGIECGFTMNCVWQCYGNGDQESQTLFQQLAFCVMQQCGLNIDNVCVIGAFATDCAQQYQQCAADQ